MDDDFASIAKAIMWGRCVNDAVRKFLQFQISTDITAVSSNEEESVLTAVQLLWINIIMDTFAALALATDPASKSLLDRKTDTYDERGVKAARSGIERVIDLKDLLVGDDVYLIGIFY